MWPTTKKELIGMFCFLGFASIIMFFIGLHFIDDEIYFISKELLSLVVLGGLLGGGIFFGLAAGVYIYKDK